MKKAQPIFPQTFQSGVALFIAAALLFAGGPAVGTDVDTETHVRHLDVWYGTATLGAGASLDGLELTDHISQNLATQIQATYGDGRVTGDIQGWVSTTNDMEWVLASPENLPAEQNLRDAFSQYLANCQGMVTFDDPTLHHTTEFYFLTTWVTTEQGITQHDGYAEVAYHRTNATCAHLAPALDRTGLLLLLMLLTVVAVLRLRESPSGT